VDRNTNGESSTIFDTFCTIKKPAKKCRIFLASSRIQELDKLTTTGTFFRLVGLEYTGNKNYEVNVSWWNFFFLPNRIWTFAFKFYNNILGLNTRTSHFIINPNRNCTFCSLRDGSAADESFLHLFFQCPTTRSWQNEFMRQKLNGIAANDNDSKKLWFLGTVPGSQEPNPALLTAVLIFQYCCWEEKLRKRLPSFRTIYNLFEDLFNTCLGLSPELREIGSKLPFLLFRRPAHGP
jgi:hypothetical protein